MLKRTALKLKGEKNSKAIFTTVKLTPQTKLINISIRSTEENLDFEGLREASTVIAIPQHCMPYNSAMSADMQNQN